MPIKPKVPMRAGDLPKQRIALVVAIPPRPAGFLAETDLQKLNDPPRKMPRTARYIGQMEWAWSPNNSRLDAYYLSTDARRARWYLWIRFYDDDWGRWAAPQVYARAPKKSVPPKVAAILLLADAWAEETRESQLDHFHWINEAGFLSVEELRAIGRAVWPDVAARDESGGVPARSS
jgi:hypothetical protein